MGVRPEGMERWGVVGIFKEAGRLLHKHFRLFLPFFLAFRLPASLLSVFQIVFLVTSGPPQSYTGVGKSAVYTILEGGEVDTNSQAPLILSMTLSLLTAVCGTLALAAFTYIVAYIYSSADTESEDDSITKKVFKLLPLALLRMFVTSLWILLVLALLAFAWGICAVFLNAILNGITGGSGPTPAFALFLMVPLFIASIALSIMFAVAPFIAVLEPGKYGRAALKLSTKYTRGRAGTTFSVVALTTITGVLLMVAPTQAVARATLPLWMEIIVATILGVLYSALDSYLGTVGIVMYFVIKSNFEAVLPEFQRGSNIPRAENLYEPLVPGSTKPETIGEP